MPTLHQLNFAVAFFAGLATFLSPCFLPLIPVYLGYLSGLALSPSHLSFRQRWFLLRLSATFISGAIVAFLLLNATFHRLSLLLHRYHSWLKPLAGLTLLLFGLYLMGLFKSKLLSREFRFHFSPSSSARFRYLHAFLTGIAFTLAWSPCIGPVLGTILFWTSSQATFLKGAILLLFYGLGLGLPFLIFAFAFDLLSPWLKKLQAYTPIFHFLSGLIVALFGSWLIFTNLNF